MSRRYSLKTKISALNEIEEHDGDVARVAEFQEIPARTLGRWLHEEDDLRSRYRKKRNRQRERLTIDLQFEMLERSKSILARMDEDRLAKAPLNQLATALGSLVSQALKLEEVIEDIDDKEEEQVIRWEFVYDGQIHEAPPWAEAGDEAPRAVQGGRLREALGQDRAGQNGAAGADRLAEATGLVVGADSDDGEPGLARSESEPAKLARRPRQREREAH